MRPVSEAGAVRELLSRPWPVACLEGAFGRAPRAVCYAGPARLGDVCRWSVSPAALRWREGRCVHDPAAVARLRLLNGIWSSPDGRRLFDGPGAALLGRLPAGVVDRLLHALDRANGYRDDLFPDQLRDDDDLTALYASTAVWLTGLLPPDPEAALCVQPYDFAALAAAEAAAMIRVPGGEVRLEVLSWPGLLAAAVRCGPEPGAPPLLDQALARELPYGAARTLIEVADRLSEMGGPDAGVRFLDPARAGLDGAGAVALEADRPVPQRVETRPAG